MYRALLVTGLNVSLFSIPFVSICCYLLCLFIFFSRQLGRNHEALSAHGRQSKCVKVKMGQNQNWNRQFPSARAIYEDILGIIFTRSNWFPEISSQICLVVVIMHHAFTLSPPMHTCHRTDILNHNVSSIGSTDERESMLTLLSFICVAVRNVAATFVHVAKVLMWELHQVSLLCFVVKWCTSTLLWRSEGASRGLVHLKTASRGMTAYNQWHLWRHGNEIPKTK